MARLLTKYKEEVAPQLSKEFGLDNPMRVPRVDKITCNIGVGEASRNAKLLEMAMEQLANITGQKPVVRRARKSIAAFKLREGMPVGAKVTLRQDRMYEFLDRLIAIALPRVRDFRGLNPRSFDGRGTFALGIQEQIVFAEIDYDKIDKIRGMDIAVTTSARTNEEGLALLRAFNFPFRN